jgi:hypothetical protein
LIGIAIPASVETIDDAAFRGCRELEYCVIEDNAALVGIGEESFAECHCLRSLYVPRGVEAIGVNSFRRCASLLRLKFESCESLKKVVSDMTLDQFLKHLGFAHVSSVFKLEIDGGIMESDWADLVSFFGESSLLTLIPDP